MFHLADFKAEHLLEVSRLADEEQVEGPASAEVSHDDGIHWHGGKEVPPGSLKFLQGSEKPEVEHIQKRAARSSQR